jgi:carboxymethylenebutenolidase
VVVQEIFGVNQHIRKVADSFAADGYVAVPAARAGLRCAGLGA